jgi:hypothetical protein
MHYLFCFLLFVLLQTATYGQQDSVQQAPMRIVAERKPYYGIASFYADKFNGRPTANGESTPTASLLPPVMYFRSAPGSVSLICATIGPLS